MGNTYKYDHETICERTFNCKSCSRDICIECSIPHNHDHKEPSLPKEHYLCKSCVMKEEKNTVFRAISEGIQLRDDCLIFESGVISIISSYAVGIVVQCSNATEECNAKISISTRFDLDISSCWKVDSDGNNIIVQNVDTVSESDDENTITTNYGKRRQIICAKCTQHMDKSADIMADSATEILMGTHRMKWNVFEPFTLELSDHECSDSDFY